MAVKRVAIIGAGASGLTAIKCCLDEGLEPVCFERTAEIGGLWNFTEACRDGQACIMKSTVINSSKEMMSFSDFPVPKEYSIYMHNTYVNKYFHLYANEFDLMQHIRFNTEIVHAKQTSDFKETGKWKLEIRDVKQDLKTTEVFDALFVCTGHHAVPNMPSFAGLENFKGKVLHTHDYKDMKGYEGKKIVVIGIGNSGGDVAVELSRVSQVLLSTRRGTWVLNRIFQNGLPVDMVITTRLVQALFRKLPLSIRNSLLQGHLNGKFDHEKFALKPKHGVFSQHPMVNDDLPNRIVCGAMKIKSDVKCVTETGVEFDDGTIEDDVDVIILATGYIFGFPFLDKSVIDVKENRVQLFKYMFPPDIEKQTCAIIGCLQPMGAIMPICELQCRLATRVFKGIADLPSRGEMWADIKHKEIEMAKRYVATQRHTIQVEYIAMMDELAELVGCKPDIVKMFTSDPHLAWECLKGPCTPYQYRLVGPHQWGGARDAIFSQWENTFYPLKTRAVEKSTGSYIGSLIRLLFILLLVAIFLTWLF